MSASEISSGTKQNYGVFLLAFQLQSLLKASVLDCPIYNLDLHHSNGTTPSCSLPSLALFNNKDITNVSSFKISPWLLARLFRAKCHSSIASGQGAPWAAALQDTWSVQGVCRRVEAKRQPLALQN